MSGKWPGSCLFLGLSQIWPGGFSSESFGSEGLDLREREIGRELKGSGVKCVEKMSRFFARAIGRGCGE